MIHLGVQGLEPLPHRLNEEPSHCIGALDPHEFAGFWGCGEVLHLPLEYSADQNISSPAYQDQARWHLISPLRLILSEEMSRRGGSQRGEQNLGGGFVRERTDF